MIEIESEELERLRDVNRDLAACLALPAVWARRDPPYILATLLDMLVSMLQLDLVHAAICDANGQVTLEASRPQTAPAGWMTQPVQQWASGDSADGLPADLPGIGNVRLARVPLRLQSGHGVVVAASVRSNFPTEREMLLLRATVNQTAIALNTAELVGAGQTLLAREQEARREAEAALSMLERLEAVMDGTLSARRVNELLSDLLRHTRAALNGDTAVMLLLDADQSSLIPVASDGFDEDVGASVSVPLGSGVAGHIATSDAGLIIDDVQAVEVIRSSLREQVRSLIGTPLRLDGRLIGVVHVGTVTPRQFTSADLAFLRMVADRAALTIERARLYEAEQVGRAHAERAAEQLRLALEAGRMGTWEWTIGSGELKWSPGLEAIHGFAPAMFPGTFEAFRSEIHPDDRDRVLGEITDALEGRRQHHVEYRIVRRDGAVRWVEGHGQLFVDAKGRPERMVGVCMDITERKQAEERFRLAVEAAPTAMVMVDRQGTILLVNALTEQLLGYARPELIGQSVDQLVPLRFRDQHAGYRTSFSSDPRRRPMGVGRDLYALRKDGSEVSVEIGLSPFETSDGVFVLAAITDITQRKLAEEEKAALLRSEQIARRELERVSRLKDEFLAIVSHELRTPLTAVLGWAEMLRHGVLDQTGRREALDALYANAKRQARLIDDLLDGARIMSGKLGLERTVVDLRGVVRGALEVVQPAADAKRIHISTEIDPTVGEVLGDATRLQQVVWNLLTNAVKFTPDGGAIHLGVRQSGAMMEISVTDTGKGIPADFLPRVFEPFQQAEGSTTRSLGGLGLGLSIVKHLVEAHGGAVTAESAGEGHGSTFTVRLPGVDRSVAGGR